LTPGTHEVWRIAILENQEKEAIRTLNMQEIRLKAIEFAIPLKIVENV